MSEFVQPVDPCDEYDRKHGSPGPDAPTLSPAELFGEKLNPVRETASPFKNLSTATGK